MIALLKARNTESEKPTGSIRLSPDYWAALDDIAERLGGLGRGDTVAALVDMFNAPTLPENRPPQPD